LFIFLGHRGLPEAKPLKVWTQY